MTVWSNLNLLYMKLITLGCGLAILLTVSCSPALSKDLEVEHSITMNSYFDDTVRKAMEEDINTRINASFLDLETGDTNEIAQTDVFYRLDCGSDCFPIFIGTEKVKLKTFGDQEPTKLECEEMLKNQKLGKGTIAIKYGTYTCVQTSEGRLGWIRYDKDFYSGMKPFNIQITYWVWKEAKE